MIEENTLKYINYDKQFKIAEKTIENLSNDNKELKKQLLNKDTLLKSTQIEETSQELSLVLNSKNLQIERLKDQSNKQEAFKFLSLI